MRGEGGGGGECEVVVEGGDGSYAMGGGDVIELEGAVSGVRVEEGGQVRLGWLCCCCLPWWLVGRLG